MNETERVRIWRESKRKLCPDGCGQMINYKSDTCRKCYQVVKRERALDRTVAQVKKENKSLRYTDHIRCFARVMHPFKECEICGYNKMVQVCHIKPVASFPDTATIREINDKSNVRGLCPNHHWEFDNGLL